MALDMEQEIIRHQRGWALFARFLLLSTAALVIALGVLALTLL